MKDFLLQIIYKILATYARRVIKRHNPFVVAITGSVGKTSTKEAIYTVLSESFGREVRKNEGNLNAEIGLPLTILGYKALPNKFMWPIFLILAGFRSKVKKYPKYLVLEMGVEKPGDIKYLTGIVKPDIAVITSVSGAHLANFENKKKYEDEKIAILNFLKPNGVGIINQDDQVLCHFQSENIKTISIEDNSADYWADSIRTSSSGTEFRINCTGHKISIESKLLGRQLVYPQIIAFAVADILNISLLLVGKSLKKLRPIPGRMNLIEGENQTTIIDDTYNSNPSSLKAALVLLGEIQHRGRKVAIIGNMNELGAEEKSSHQEIGHYAREKCDLAVFVGPNAKLMARSCGTKDCLSIENRKELFLLLSSLIHKNDLILVKASQNGNFFEEVVKKLMKNPTEARKLLVRQSKFWLNKKRKLSY
ncbi:MAG: UDP-N-acetylmuramoyl-tripeptide--D-alanyl-D-alanine ligase [Patescibacteria group bacterium]|nr:UDP-N-acetylmuramoyl-tripeptide--D-alanyl-D-alanine ligase [Patescibacteria group bacterium]